MLLLPSTRRPLLRRLQQVHVLGLSPDRATQNEMPGDATTGEALMPRNPAIKPQDIVPSHPDALGCLGDREGWDAADDGNGWTHKESGVTARRNSTYQFEVTHPGGNRYATSATGALCIVDQILDARAAE